MNISSTEQLNKYLNNVLKQVINEITDKIEKQLKDFIDKDIYNTYSPSIYNRTYQFRDTAWLKETATILSNTIKSSISYNPTGLTINNETYSHIDRNNLAEILNRGTTDDWAGWKFGRTKDKTDWEYPKPFFDHTLDWIKNNLRKMVIDSFSKKGFTIS